MGDYQPACQVLEYYAEIEAESSYIGLQKDIQWRPVCQRDQKEELEEPLRLVSLPGREHFEGERSDGSELIDRWACMYVRMYW